MPEDGAVTVQQLLAKIGQLSVQLDIANATIEKLSKDLESRGNSQVDAKAVEPQSGQETK